MSKNYFVSGYLKYQMSVIYVDSIPTNSQDNSWNNTEGMNLDEQYQVIVIIKKIIPFLKRFQKNLRHNTKKIMF